MTEQIEQFKKQFPLRDIQQIYSGYISDISTKCYNVYLKDCTGNEDLTAEMYKDKFPEPNLPLGRIFYWFLGVDENNNGFAHIELSKAAWTQEMIEQSRVEAQKLYKLLNNKNKLAD